MKMKRLGIVGAGPAGLGAAWALRDWVDDLVVFEKSRGFGGRAASRTRHGIRVDPGANYFKTDTPEVRELVLEVLPTGDLTRIEGDIWTFDADGRFSPGDPEQNREERWTYRTGISTLGKELAALCEAEFRRETRVARLEAAEEGGEAGWEVFDSEGDSLGAFQRVLLTAPVPQVVEILDAGEATAALLNAEGTSLRESIYHRQFCLIWGFDGPVPRPGAMYAALNVDRAHAVSWLSFEHDKPERVPRGKAVVMAQMSPDWSAARFDEDPSAVEAAALEEVDDLLGWGGIEPEWTDRQRWKFAHPANRVSPESTAGLEAAGIYLAGDGFVGKGRVGQALQTGMDIARVLKGAST